MTFAKPALLATCRTPPLAASTHREVTALHLLSAPMAATCGSYQQGGSRAAGDGAIERHAVLPVPWAVKSGSKPSRHAPPICAMLRREMHEAFKANRCCCLSGL